MHIAFVLADVVGVLALAVVGVGTAGGSDRPLARRIAYVCGLVLVGIGEGLVMMLVYVALGVPHPILLGALTAIAAMIPFGAPAAFGLAALLLLGQGATMPALVNGGVTTLQILPGSANLMALDADLF